MPARIEMLILDVPPDDLSICRSGTAQGEYVFTIAAQERTLASIGSAQEMYFATTDRYLFVVSDPDLRDAVGDALGAISARC